MFNNNMMAAAVALVALVLGGCSGAEKTVKQEPAVPPAAQQAQAAAVAEYFEVYHDDGRLYVFGDAATYAGFIAGKELVYTVARIGAGPQGQTVVFGMTKEDSKKAATLPAIAVYEGRLGGADKDFYGEIVRGGRHFVFDAWKDMQDFRSSGEAAYTFAYIGAGPGRATVTYVRNKATSKEVPTALMERFRLTHRLS